MKVTWEVNDGYVGKSRPQTTEVNDGELTSCETFEEAMNLIEEAVQYDFEQRISWHHKDLAIVEDSIRELLNEDA